MSEENVFFKAGTLKLAGLLDRGRKNSGVVITHPHPQFGGSMQNNVVDALQKAYRKAGFTTLRFNFRGVGKSDGHYDEGIGEQSDVQGAVAYIKALGMTTIHLAGYSFGAWVSARTIGEIDAVDRLVMVSPPVNFMDFSFLKYTPQLRLVITGSRDDIAPEAMIQKMLPEWNQDSIFRVIQGADHFYWDTTGEIESVLKAFLKEF